MTRTYADICLDIAEKAQGIAVQRHFSLETGCDAWLELQKLDADLRDKIAPQLARRLKRACDALRMVNEHSDFSLYKDLADELESIF